MAGTPTALQLFKEQRRQAARLLGQPPPTAVTPKDFAALSPTEQLEFKRMAAMKKIELLLPVIEDQVTKGWALPTLSPNGVEEQQQTEVTAALPSAVGAASIIPGTNTAEGSSSSSCAGEVPRSAILCVAGAALEYLQCTAEAHAVATAAAGDGEAASVVPDAAILRRFATLLPEISSLRSAMTPESVESAMNELRRVQAAATAAAKKAKRARASETPRKGAAGGSGEEAPEQLDGPSPAAQGTPAPADKAARKERKPRGAKKAVAPAGGWVVVNPPEEAAFAELGEGGAANGAPVAAARVTAAKPRKPRAKKSAADTTPDVPVADAPSAAPLVVAAKASAAPSRRRSRKAEGVAADSVTGAAADVPKPPCGTDAPPPQPSKPPRARAGALPTASSRTLSAHEKALCGALRESIAALGLEAALRTNAIPTVMAGVKERLLPFAATTTTITTAAAVSATPSAPAEGMAQQPMERGTSATFVAAAIEAANDAIAAFNAQPQLQQLLDEDILHGVAHRCLRALNEVEGFHCRPAPKQTPAQQQKKAQERAARIAKLESEAKEREVRLQAEAVAREEKRLEKEREAQKKRELQDAKRAKLTAAKEALQSIAGATKHLASADDEALLPDVKVSRPRQLGFVAYSPLPIQDPADYEMALSIWAFLVSLPSALRVEQFSFSLFLRVVTDANENEIVDDIVSGLLGAIRASGQKVSDTPGATPRGVTARSATASAVDRLKEFILYASGRRARLRAEAEQRRLERLRQQQAEEEEEEEEDEEDDEEEDEEEEDEEEDDSTSSDDDEDEEEDEDDSGPARGRARPVMTRARAAASGGSSKGGPSNSDHAAGAGKGAVNRRAAGNAALKAAGSKRKRAEGSEGEGSGSDSDDRSAPRGGKAKGRRAGSEPAGEKRDGADDDAPASGPQEETFEFALKQTMDAVAALRSYATWPNIEVHDRLVMLMFLVRQCMACKVAVEAAATLATRIEADLASFEKKLRDLQEQAKANLKALGKGAAADAEDVAEQRKGIHDALHKAVASATSAFLALADTDDHGTRIRPLGIDRYRRLYWRFPKSSVIMVETTPETDLTFPVYDVAPPLPSASTATSTPGDRKLLIDEEGEDDATMLAKGVSSSTGGPAEQETSGKRQQRQWGVIEAEHLPAFVESLETRGRNEAALKQKLQPFIPYLQKLQQSEQALRMTRSRVKNNGYSNKYRLL